MTNEQLAANYTKPETLTNEQLAAAITDEDIENYIKFSSTNGGTVWRDVLEEAARRLTHKWRCASGIAEVVRRDDVERRIWAHYDHARTKHPHFCDKLVNYFCATEDVVRERARACLEQTRSVIDKVTQSEELTWRLLLICETDEIEDAIASGDKSAAVEECYDAIAVLLRVVDVLEGRQALGKPEGQGAAQ